MWLYRVFLDLQKIRILTFVQCVKIVSDILPRMTLTSKTEPNTDCFWWFFPCPLFKKTASGRTQIAAASMSIAESETPDLCHAFSFLLNIPPIMFVSCHRMLYSKTSDDQRTACENLIPNSPLSNAWETIAALSLSWNLSMGLWLWKSLMRRSPMRFSFFSTQKCLGTLALIWYELHRLTIQPGAPQNEGHIEPAPAGNAAVDAIIGLGTNLIDIVPPLHLRSTFDKPNRLKMDEKNDQKKWWEGQVLKGTRQWLPKK